MLTLERSEMNGDDQNKIIRAYELLKVDCPGIMSDFDIYFTVSDNDEDNENFVLNATSAPFPKDVKVLGVIPISVFDDVPWVIVYS